ncbi:MAG: GDP-mannose 4,6-dehydratase [Thermoproteota archaeon]
MAFWKDSKVLITGANGFAGSRLCRRLVEKEAEVYAMVRDSSATLNLRDIIPKIHLVYGDVRYPETVYEVTNDMDYVFNLAAKVNIEETRKNPSETLRTNINGTLNVANACLRNKVKRLVHVSTCHIYGNPAETDLPITEKTIPSPLDVYSISKYSAEFLVQNVRTAGLDAVITRAFNHYGPGQTGDFFIAKVIKMLLTDTVPKLGSSRPTRDYSYVDDIVAGYILACEKGKNGEIYHFASGKEISIDDMYKRICDVIGKHPTPVWQSERVNDMSRSFGKYEKAEKELGWEPMTSLEEGLKLTIQWWKQNAKLLLD